MAESFTQSQLSPVMQDKSGGGGGGSSSGGGGGSNSEPSQTSADNQKGDGKGESLIDIIDRSMDDHEPGHKAAKTEEVPTSQNVWEDMDKASQVFEQALEEAKKRDRGELDPIKPNKTNTPGSEPSKRAVTTVGNKINQPKITWQQILDRLIRSTDKQSDEEVRTKINPRKAGIAASEMEQTGKAIVPPVNPMEPYYPKVFFVVDSSASMSHVIQAIQNKVKAIVSSPLLQRCVFAFMRFSSSYEIFYGKFSSNEAAIVPSLKTKPVLKPNPSLSSLLNVHLTGGTVFSAKEQAIAMEALAQGYNIILATDSDLAHNPNLLAVYNKDRRRVFIIFDCESAYMQFMAYAKLTSADTITYFK